MAVNPFASAIQEAAETTNMNEAQTGGDYTPPAAGLVRLRFVGYMELGKHDKEYQGKTSQKEFVQLLFEASGPKHPPREDGTPIMFSLRMVKSQSDKAGFFKLFRRMNPSGSAKHMAELLGNAYIGTVVHNVVGEGDQKKTYANLKDSDGVWTIREPFIDNTDPESGEVTRTQLQVAEPTTPIRCFIWDSEQQLSEMWSSIFIDGQWDAKTDDKGKVTQEAKSKNVYQNAIRSAHNWQGSRMQELLFAGGEADIPDAEKPGASGSGNASADPLEGAG
ncbi:hypothetical protein SPS_44 [Sphingomonas phage Scott]|uniref:Uncharacterized protein n=1 Tax=Sphingomonas phage Scott TaxID=2282912 RepID=A0A346FDE1_9CAUD|nr:hypothetical protein HOT83_gp44 [Sphingomonas phage Scott]AXN53755.1 hypothetical protein SPS_44 [Sphingomonas phage Scott]